MIHIIYKVQFTKAFKLQLKLKYYTIALEKNYKKQYGWNTKKKKEENRKIKILFFGKSKFSYRKLRKEMLTFKDPECIYCAFFSGFRGSMHWFFILPNSTSKLSAFIPFTKEILPSKLMYTEQIGLASFFFSQVGQREGDKYF